MTGKGNNQSKDRYRGEKNFLGVWERGAFTRARDVEDGGGQGKGESRTNRNAGGGGLGVWKVGEKRGLAREGMVS